MLGTLVAIVVANHGAPLEAPADPAGDDYPARPEWYFLWLFQLLKYFHGEREIIATVIVPGAIVTVLFLIPLLDKVLPRGLAHFLACAIVFGVVGGAGYLTYAGWRADATDPSYRAGRERAERAAARAVQLAGNESIGIPPDGAAYLLSRDPLHRGGGLFEAKCAGCHAFGGKASKDQSAPDLKDYGTRAWIRGLLDKPDAPGYFGTAPACDGMATWKGDSKLTAKDLDDVADFVATFAAIDPETSPEDWAAEAKAKDHPGRKPFYSDCAECHTMGNVAEPRQEDAGVPRPLRLGLQAMDSPDDPGSGPSGAVRLPPGRAKDADLWRATDGVGRLGPRPLPQGGLPPRQTVGAARPDRRFRSGRFPFRGPPAGLSEAPRGGALARRPAALANRPSPIGRQRENGRKRPGNAGFSLSRGEARLDSVHLREDSP